MEDKLEKFAKLYERIHECSKCINAADCNMMKEMKGVKRIVEKRALTSKIFLVGQALGGQTQRVSGRPYINLKGKLSQTGQNLDKFLKPFEFTIDPFNSSSGCQYTYSSDIFQCYPGKNRSGDGDRKPNIGEIINCISQRFLLDEIELIEPRLVLLMGKESRNTFYKHILRISFPPTLSEHIKEVISLRHLPIFHVGNRDISIAPIQHPSCANPHFHQMGNNIKLIELIREVLRDK